MTADTPSVLTGLKPLSRPDHPREMIRQFTPNWFAATMGILAAQGLAGVGTVAQGIGVVAGLCLWGFGLWWLALATLLTIRYWRAGVPFNLGWWGYTFPLGVYTVATFRLGTTLNLGFFGIVGKVLTIALAAMWLLVGAKTLAGAWRGNLFVSPCIATPN